MKLNFKLTPQIFSYVLAGLLAVIVAGGGYLYYLASQSLHADTTKLSRKLADQQIAEDRIADLQQLKVRYRELQPILVQLDAALPATKNESELSLQLQNLAAASGMTINSISFPASTALPSTTSQTVKQGTVLAIPVSFELSGSYDQLRSFLRNQEALTRITNVSSLTISRGVGGNLKFGVGLSAFIKPSQ